MSFNLSLNILLIVVVFFIYLHLSFCDIKYLKFANNDEALLNKATNFATLSSGSLDVLPFNRFTICSSIYIGYFKGFQSFYLLRRNDHGTLWFNLYIYDQNIENFSYKADISYYNGSVFPNTGAKLPLKPHAWSHACTAVNVDSSHITVVINGILAYNMKLTNYSKDFAENVPPVFQKKLDSWSQAGEVPWDSKL